MTKTRKYYIDIIKILCIIIVCFGHSGDTGFMGFQYSTGLVQILKASITIVCKASIPLFFLCTGALLLAKEESIADLWKKRVLKYVLIIILFTTTYYVILSLKINTPIDIPFILKTMYSTWGYSHSGSYWFLYSYIAFLILLPLLRLIARGLNKELVRYMVIVNTVACGVLPIIESRLGMDDIAIDIMLLTKDVFFYPLIGYYIEQCEYEEICNKKNILILFGMSIFALVTSVGFTLDSLWNKGLLTQDFFNIFQCYIAFFVYIGAKMLNSKIKISDGLGKVISELGMCTLGIYLIHGMVYIFVDDFFVQYGIPFTYGVAWLRALSVFGLSLIIVWVCRRIPGLKKIF